MSAFFLQHFCKTLSRNGKSEDNSNLLFLSLKAVSKLGWTKKILLRHFQKAAK